MKDDESQEELIAEEAPIQGISSLIRIVISLAAVAVLGTSIFLIWKYINEPGIFPAPQELQLSNLIIFSLSVLFFSLMPWEKLGIRIRKIGPVEFYRVVSTQAKENAEEFAELHARIEELEHKAYQANGLERIVESFTAKELDPLILSFLFEFQPKAYSPLKIQKWGSRQPGFEKLGNFDQGAIKAALQRLVAKGTVGTKVSRLGNTLYKVVDAAM